MSDTSCNGRWRVLGLSSCRTRCASHGQLAAAERVGLLLADGAELANGPFAPGSLGHVADPGFPAFDPAAGSAILDEIGRPGSIRYSTTVDSANLLAAELFVDMWSTNCGLDVEIDQFQQSELVTRAITADFGMLRWRNHGRGNPGLEIHTWHSRHAVGIATNVGRLVDPEIDQLLFDALATTDDAQIDAIGQQITQLFATTSTRCGSTTTSGRSRPPTGSKGSVSAPCRAGRAARQLGWARRG